MSEAAPNTVGVALRVGLFVLIGLLGKLIFPALLLPLSGLLLAAVFSTFATAAVANAVTVRIYERGRLADLGLGWAPLSGREFLTGALGGGCAALTILVGPLALGLVKFETAPKSEHPWASLAFVGFALLFGAIGEEMLFHGYAFQVLVRAVGGFATVLPVSILFGLAHLGNENVNILGIANTMIWGFVLGYAYLRTGALWLSIGLHFGWNFVLPLFGANLSGFTMGVTGYALVWRTGDLWSGGGYGPEGSLLTTGIVVALFFVLRRVVSPSPLTEVGGGVR